MPLHISHFYFPETDQNVFLLRDATNYADKGNFFVQIMANHHVLGVLTAYVPIPGVVEADTIAPNSDERLESARANIKNITPDAFQSAIEKVAAIKLAQLPKIQRPS